MSETLCPFVRWAQDERNIYLKVELQNVEDPELLFKSTKNNHKVDFRALGDGAKGRNQYGFQLNLVYHLDEKECIYKVSARCVNIVLRKAAVGWWPRLTSSVGKISWLTIDFERWRSDPQLDDPEEEDEEGKRKDIFENFDMESYERQQADEMMEKMMRDKVAPLNLTKPYLLTYNSAMFVGFLMILVELALGYYREGADYFPKVYKSVGSKLICCQIAQFFEIIHSALGYVKSSWFVVSMQVGGRAFVLFILLGSEPRLQDKPFVFYLFFVWCLVEIFRYPYYALAVMKKEQSIITWLRYSVWIVLYPLGFLLEGVIILRSMPYFEETQKFNYPMPNALNISVDFVFCLKFYLMCLFLPGMVMLMSHMRKQRLQKLRSPAKKLKTK